MRSKTPPPRSAKWGARVREIDLPQAFSGLHALARGTINHYERAACMAFEWDHHREALSPQMRRYIESGQRTPRADYVAAWRRVEQCRALLPKVFEEIDVLLTPCVPGEAPKGLASTGDPSMQVMWTALHTPSMTLPTHRGPNNLPVGIQLIAQRYDDDRLFASARWIWDRIGAAELVGCWRVEEWSSTIRSTAASSSKVLGSLMNIPRIAPCMPGAQLTEIVDPQNFKGKIAVRLGPVALTFDGGVAFESIDDANHTARVKAQGSDAKGRGAANATAMFRIEPAATGSKMLIHNSLRHSPPVAQTPITPHKLVELIGRRPVG